MKRPSAIRQRFSNAETLTPGRGNLVGDRVRLARQRRSLTMIETCQLIEQHSGYAFHQSTLTRIELGTRSVYDFEVAALSLALDVDARFLLGLVPDDQA
ncbi:helix-turn-helix domain-containing protein [Deinococcus sp. QL22]|uniref:helix-turn-helix domain-containing protein n=1 Tax=Deinococcus sp. QL22 TaxID=2939437 RepID=UPI0020170FDB|nr:helix-turn-helix domain-containing protein [Deinococcus sp. QL22]UQN08444.1 helix-turn-helix domain-containing protein [Deinococcus sp. QL22]